MKIKNKLLLVFTLSVYSSLSFSAITIDRTRVVYDGSDKSVSVGVFNRNTEKPYLAQAWVENLDGVKIDKPFVVTPPLQRIDGGDKSQIRIEALPSISEFPQDRESAFYFNVREIPPKPSRPNTLQLALQTQVKLFYRPKSIVISSTEMANHPWQEKMVLLKNDGKVFINNPTPYYITVLNIGSKNKSDTDLPMVPPFSKIKTTLTPNDISAGVKATYVNDYGGKVEVDFICNNSECKVKK